jgi:hypothetical protein
LTALPAYDKLGMEMTLPSKGIFIQDHAINETWNGTTMEGIATTNMEDDASEYGMISIGMNKILAAELGGFSFESSPIYDFAADGDGWHVTDPIHEVALKITTGTSDNYLWFPTLPPVLNYSETMPNFGQVNNPVDISYRIKGRIFCRDSVGLDNIKLVFARLPQGLAGEVNADYEYIIGQDIFFSGTSTTTGNLGSGAMNENDVQEFDLSFTETRVLQEGDRFYLCICLFHKRTEAQADGDNPGLEIVFDTESFFKASTISITDATAAKVFMVNETLSRISEAISEDRLRVYSDYFGRTDSQPYTAAADGCGALEVITKGLFIRRAENRIEGEPFLMTLSMKDCFEGLDPIHHIGFGIEGDPYRTGFKMVRIEPWKYFYKEDIILDCSAVRQIDRKCMESEVYGTFKFGFEKWEAEEYNGLDEFLTKRTYRTTLSEVKNELTKISKFIASGYAWEITRRKNDADSKDWRFDNDNFIACVKRDTREYSVELSGHFTPIAFVSTTEPVGVVVGDVVTITGSTFNDGTYTILAITEIFIIGGWRIYLEEPTVTEAGATITMSRENPGFMIEQGNASESENVISPETAYNLRLSPVRNAMRWMNKVFASYKNWDYTNKILFTEGDGNYLAQTKLVYESGCELEAVPIKENMPIDYTLFFDFADLYPLMQAERIEFDYPMSLYDFRNIMSNPYGLIQFNNTCGTDAGWIETISYKPEEGLAKFILIPKYIVI